MSKFNSKIALGLLALIMTINAYSCSENKEEAPVIENEIGVTDINPWFNPNLTPENFVIFDMGDHDTVKTHLENKKISYCAEHDMSVGVIISSAAQTESEIYDDVEYAKGLVKKHNIAFPVYLNINNIITNDNLNNEMKIKLIKNFLEKCSSNNIYVGLYGTDTNLCRVKKYCGISEYDAFLVQDSENVKYDGYYSVIQQLDGTVKTITDISQAIAKSKLNNANRFVNDGAYKVEKNDELIDIALRYGMSVKELLEFNDLKNEEIAEGTILRIPSIIDKTISGDLKISYEDLEEPIRGCDISYAQGTNIEWDKIVENFDYIILKCSQGTTVDNCFEINAKNANINNIPIGVYCYNGFTKDNSDSKDDFVKKQEHQADTVLNLLKNKKIDYPIYLDIEAPNGQSLADQLDSDYVQEMIKIWCNKMIESGYTPGIYCNQSGFKYLQECVDYDLTEILEVWIAGGEQYTGETKDIPFEEIVPSDRVKENNPNATMIQATDSAVNAGAGNHLGHLDINFCYKDYENKIITGSMEETFELKEFDRTDMELYLTIGGIGAVGVTAVAIAGALAAKKQREKTIQKRNIK